MTPVTQTKVVVRNSAGEMVVRGNCYAAAIASMLDLSIDEVPNVEVLFHIEKPVAYWAEVMHTFLVSRGCDIVSNHWFQIFHGKSFDGNAEEVMAYCKDRYYLVSGDSIRGVKHICIYRNGSLVHDPHPTREGLINEEYFEEIIQVN